MDATPEFRLEAQFGDGLAEVLLHLGTHPSDQVEPHQSLAEGTGQTPQDVPRQLGLLPAPPTAKVIDGGLSSAVGARAQFGIDHAAVAMPESAAHRGRECGGASPRRRWPRSLRGSGKPVKWMRSAENPVLHQTLAG